MTQFFHDQKHNVLVYENQNPFVLQNLPEAKLIGRTHFAVPFNLTNCQVLRYFNHPVPTVMDGYDWPHAPGIKPYASQKIAANFMVLHRRCFNLSDMGCVAGDTQIETDKGSERVDSLARRKESIFVKALVDGVVKIVPAACPFVKGVDKLYRVCFASGRSIDVTSRHFFWTCRGWVSCGDLVVGEPLPKFDDALPASNLESFLSKSPPNAPHWTQTIPGFQDYFYTRACDAQLLQDEDNGRSLAPSQGGVPEHNRLGLQKDARGTKHKNMGRLGGAPLSKRRYSARGAQYHTGFLTCESTTKLIYNGDCAYGQYRQFSTPVSPVRASQELLNDCARYRDGTEFCVSKHETVSQDSSRQNVWRLEQSPDGLEQASDEVFQYQPLKTWEYPVDYVTHIAYLKTDVYYDLHVPVHENYIAHGLCHHNTGKTLAMLWAADWLMQQYPKGECRALIVAPLSTLQRVWGDAIFKNFLSRRSFEILHGDAAKRSLSLSKKADFYVVNFDGVGVGAHTRNRLELDGFSRELAERSDIRIAIVDEASAYKDSTTKRHRISRLVFGKKEYLWCLTGTPTPNAPTDAYGLAKLVNNAFGKSFSTFQSESMMKISQFIWKPQRDGYVKARQLLSPSIRFDIKDVWDGPELTTQQREVPLTDQQKKLIADLRRDLQITIKSGEPITAVNEAALRTKFIQIVLGAVYDSDHKAHTVDAAPRLNELTAVIEQAPGKLLIFVPLTSVVNLLYKELGQIKDKAGKVIQEGWSRAIVNGETSQKERAAIFEAFQRDVNSNPRILIADPGTMAHGLDLWQAQTVIWYGPTDKTELYLQANKRAHRPGQKHPVTVVKIVATPLEREIFRRLETNTSLQGALLDMVRKGEL